MRTSQAVNFGMPLETTYLHIDHKLLQSDPLMENRGIATGGRGSRIPTFLQDQFYNSTKPEEKLMGGGRNLVMLSSMT